jgi:hypothetical protein
MRLPTRKRMNQVTDHVGGHSGALGHIVLSLVEHNISTLNKLADGHRHKMKRHCRAG